MRPEGVADAQQADIPVPPRDRYDRRGDGEGYAGGVLDAPVKACSRRAGKSACAQGRDARRSRKAKLRSPRSLEKPLGRAEAPVPKRHRWAGRAYRAIGGTMVKELGIIAP